MTDHGAEFDRIYRQALRDGRTMTMASRVIAFAFSAISFASSYMIASADVRVFPADFQVLVAFFAFCFFCVGLFLAYVGSKTPSPPKEPA